jgi:hypothetical protein
MTATIPQAVQERRAREVNRWRALRARDDARILAAEPRLAALADHVAAMSVPAMLSAVRDAGWLRSANAETRALALRLLFAPIAKARRGRGMDDLSDPLPDEPDDGWWALRALLTKPPERPATIKDTPTMSIDILAMRIPANADPKAAKDLLDHFFGGSLPLQAVGLSAPGAAPPSSAETKPDAGEIPEFPRREKATAGPVEEAVAETPAPETDAAGLPWDERIHASTKALNVDGTWRRRRNIDTAEIARVEAELKGEELTETKASEPEAPEQGDGDLAALLGASEPEAPEFVLYDEGGDALGATPDPEAWLVLLADYLGTLDDNAAVRTLGDQNLETAKTLIAEGHSATVAAARKAIGDRSDAIKAAPKAQTADTAPHPDRLVVRGALQDYASARGIAALQVVLKMFDARSLDDISPDRYGALMDRLTEKSA